MIDERGIAVPPATDHPVRTPGAQRIRFPPAFRSWIRCWGAAPHRGSSILITGGPGTGKSSLLAAMARSVTAAGERCLLLSLEESLQIVRNMRPIVRPRGLAGSGAAGHRVAPCGLVGWGLETHLAKIAALVDEFEPACVLIDPISVLRGPRDEVAFNARPPGPHPQGRGITAVLTAHSAMSRPTIATMCWSRRWSIRGSG